VERADSLSVVDASARLGAVKVIRTDIARSSESFGNYEATHLDIGRTRGKKLSESEEAF